MTYIRRIETTLYENWPVAAKQRSMPTLDCCLSRDDILALGSVDPSFRAQFGLGRVKSFSSDFEDWLTVGLRENKAGSFIKTSYGSFRECPLAYKPAMTLPDAISVLRWPDSRVHRHLIRRLELGGEVVILIRPWKNIATDAEFRIFVRSGKVTAITPIHCDQFSGRLSSNALQVNDALRRFVSELCPLLPSDPVAVDVNVDFDAPNLGVELTELTPYLPSADAGLFDHANPNSFVGGFRFKTDRETVEVDAHGEIRYLPA